MAQKLDSDALIPHFSDPNSEHNGYRCVACGSTWIRFEHLDGKDCESECESPCLVRCCNEEYCIGEAEIVPLYLQ